MLIKAMVLRSMVKWSNGQISNKFHRFQQITKQGKVNLQRKANGTKRLLYFDFPRHICIFVYIYVFLLILLAANIQYFVNKLCKVCMRTNQDFKF